MTLLSNYQEAFRPQRGNQVVGNLIGDSGSGDSPAQADGGFGTGLGIAGGVDNAISRNRIAGNPRAGVLIADTEDLPATGNRLTDNVYADNGVDVANISAERAPATGNCVRGRVTTFRPPLPRRSPAARRRGGSPPYQPPTLPVSPRRRRGSASSTWRRPPISPACPTRTAGPNRCPETLRCRTPPRSVFRPPRCSPG